MNCNTYWGVSILNFVRKSEKTAQQWVRLILGVSTPQGMAKRSISSPSPNSLYIKKYDVPNICYTKSRCYQERDTRSGFPNPNYRFFSIFFLHVIRIAFVYSFTGVKVNFLFSPSLFGENVIRIFLETTINSCHKQKKTLPPLNRSDVL